jgi:hypothetical protein
MICSLSTRKDWQGRKDELMTMNVIIIEYESGILVMNLTKNNTIIKNKKNT